MAGWGIGLGAFAGGLQQGIGLGQQIQNNRLTNEMNRLKLQDMQRTADTNKQYDALGAEAQTDYDSAVQAGEADPEHADDWFAKNYAPKIEAAHLANNDVEGAAKWKAWADDAGTKKTIRHMGMLIGTLHDGNNTGDYEGFEKQFGNFYKSLPSDVQKRMGKFEGFRAETDENGQFVATASFTDDKGKEHIFSWDSPQQLTQTIEGWANPSQLYTETMKGAESAKKFQADIAEYRTKKGIDLQFANAERAAGLKGRTPQERYAAAQEVLTKASVDGKPPSDAEVRAYLAGQDAYATSTAPGIGGAAQPSSDSNQPAPTQKLIVNQKTGQVVQPPAPSASRAAAAEAAKPNPMPANPAAVTAPPPAAAQPAEAPGGQAAQASPPWWQRAAATAARNVVNYGNTGYVAGHPPEPEAPTAPAPQQDMAPIYAKLQAAPAGPAWWQNAAGVAAPSAAASPAAPVPGVQPAQPNAPAVGPAPAAAATPQADPLARQVGLGSNAQTAHNAAPLYVVTPTAPDGMIRQGNIDLNRRPSVKNADGSVSTVRSITIATPDGKAVLIPTVVGNHVVSNEEAIKHFQQTGENLGIFKDEASADRYAEALHEQQTKLRPARRH
ncbi:hypothetical protein BRDID11004_47620 [Bradyrhizobium diazoefficiens]|uniref:Uncharacterized protein n=1 Tax=Bradyrhizobium diazoefficiens TaxID=1355477 RepID=A0A809ZZT8_9BRAD|nr:hypothetical protein [Bradyrhizobium diazoefficiens]BBZ94335.1 hypothetical protein F07S3_41680 [Bradyrhizobium diazoefficiens]BCE56423.1 hypothetical protein XF5B_39350 [Bradyrhizobium diazoefficiens]